MGFTVPEVEQLLTSTLGLAPAEQAVLLEELSAWYDGYSFVPGAGRLFNPDMVLYYLAERMNLGTAPTVMLDSNIATDHGTIERTLSLGDRVKNSELLEQVMEQGRTDVALTRQYALKLGFSSHDFGSLLFYLGFLTCRGQEGDRYLLGVPNRVIGELHWRMLLTLLLERAGLDPGPAAQAITDAVHTLGFSADPRPLIEQVSALLQKRISNRDLIRFDTTGAILGGICGAGVGAAALPAPWVAGLVDWPRSRRWIEALAHTLADVLDGRTAPLTVPATPWWFWPAALLRNLAFLGVVLGHAARRLLPPY